METIEGLTIEDWRERSYRNEEDLAAVRHRLERYESFKYLNHVGYIAKGWLNPLRSISEGLNGVAKKKAWIPIYIANDDCIGIDSDGIFRTIGITQLDDTDE